MTLRSMRTSVPLLFSFALLATRAAHAQSGCVDSPECPTAVLAAVGSAAAAGLRLLARRKN